MNKKIVKICIFDKHTNPSQVIKSNGDIILDNICIKCETDESLENGEYYLDSIFRIDNEGLHKNISDEAILKIQIDYGNEYFRIANIRKTSKDIEVFARQITISETLDMWLEDVRPTNQNGQGVLTYIRNNSKGKKDIKVFSDIPSTNTAYYMNMSMYKALHDCEQSFINRWGGEIQRRGYNLTINKKIGKHRGVQIRSRKNLTGFEVNTNIDNVVTRIKPVGFDEITISGYIDSPLINAYSSIKTRKFKYDDVKVKNPGNEDNQGYDTLEEAQGELIRRATLEFTKNHIDQIKAEYRINFIQLEYTQEYMNYVQAERVYIGDEIDVYEEKLDINITVRAIRKKFDVLKQRVTEIELSNEVKKEKPPTIGDIINGFDKIENEINENNKWYQDAINNANDLIENGLKDSYVVHRKNEILIMDTTDINTAINVWRWNKGGLAFSNKGYYGDYETAITQDGSIVGKFITGLIIKGEQINAKNLNVVNNKGIKTLEVTSNGDIKLKCSDISMESEGNINIDTSNYYLNNKEMIFRRDGKKTFGIKRGYSHLYNPTDNTLMGAMIPRSTVGGQYYDNGISTVASNNCYYYSIARASDWSNDEQATFSPVEYFIVNFRDRGPGLEQGIHYHLMLYAKAGLDLYKENIYNVDSIFANDIKALGFSHKNGREMFYTDGYNMQNIVGWAWNNNNLLDPVIIGGSYGYSVDYNSRTYSKDVNLDGILDKINIYPTQTTYKTNSEKSLEIDVTELRESENADMFIKKHNTVNEKTGKNEIVENIDMKSMLHLALLEIKNLKEEVKELRQKVGV